MQRIVCVSRVVHAVLLLRASANRKQNSVQMKVFIRPSVTLCNSGHPDYPGFPGNFRQTWDANLANLRPRKPGHLLRPIWTVTDLDANLDTYDVDANLDTYDVEISLQEPATFSHTDCRSGIQRQPQITVTLAP